MKKYTFTDISHFSGTSLFYRPGLLVGGTLEHDCSRQRSIGYFLEPLIMFAPFAKKPINITLRGLTNGPLDPSVSIRLHEMYTFSTSDTVIFVLPLMLYAFKM